MRIATLLGALSIAPTLALAQVEKTYDRFKTATVVRARISGADDRGRPIPTLIGTFAGDKLVTSPTTISLLFQKTSPDWKYLQCFGTDFLLDGRPFSLGEPTHDGRVGAGYVLEFIQFTVGFTRIVELASAHTVEVKICNDEFRLSAQEMSIIKDFVRALTPPSDSAVLARISVQADSSAPPIPTPVEAASDAGPPGLAAAEFMRAVETGNLDLMASLWGTEKGSALKTGQPSDYARRIEIMRTYLQFDHVRITRSTGNGKKDKRITVVIELSRRRCIARIEARMIQARDGNWIVNSIDLAHADEVLAPCR